MAEAKRKVTGVEGRSVKGDEAAACTWNGEKGSGNAEKKKRINWTADLHNKFIEAIEKIGPNAKPMEILKVMSVPGLTRAHVASHLQKFNIALRSWANSAPPTRNGYNNSMNSAAGQSGYQSSQSSLHPCSIGMMSYGAFSAQSISRNPNFPQRFHYQQTDPKYRIHQHQVHNFQLNPSSYQAPTMLNNAPLPPRNVMSNTHSHPPLPRFHGLRFSNSGTLSNNMVNYCSFSQPLPSSAACPSALPFNPPAASDLVIADAQQNNILAHGQNYGGLATDTENMSPMICSDSKTGNFDVDDIFVTTQMEAWSMNNSNVDNRPQTTQSETSTLSNTNNNVDSFQPSTTNLLDDDDNDELKSFVLLQFNYDSPPSLWELRV